MQACSTCYQEKSHATRSPELHFLLYPVIQNPPQDASPGSTLAPHSAPHHGAVAACTSGTLPRGPLCYAGRRASNFTELSPST